MVMDITWTDEYLCMWEESGGGGGVRGAFWYASRVAPGITVTKTEAIASEWVPVLMSPTNHPIPSLHEIFILFIIDWNTVSWFHLIAGVILGWGHWTLRSYSYSPAPLKPWNAHAIRTCPFCADHMWANGVWPTQILPNNNQKIYSGPHT